MKELSWPSYEGEAKYRVTIRLAMNGATIGVLSDLSEPRCDIPAEWGDLPGQSAVRIEVYDQTKGKWFTWIPFYQISQSNESTFSIKSPIDASDFPVRLRVRSTVIDKVLLDLVLRNNTFHVPLNLFEEGPLRYKFFRYNYQSNKWDDVLGVTDYKPLDISGSDKALAEKSERGIKLRGELGLPHQSLSNDKCPFCGDPLLKVESGLNCSGCGSSARLRSMPLLVEKIIKPIFERSSSSLMQLPLLSVSMTGKEKKELSAVFHKFKSVSLFGSYGHECETGIDIRCLSNYSDSIFSGVFSSGVFDYFVEHQVALLECFRVMAPGGVFITHILSPRLTDGDEAPVNKGAIRGKPGYLEYLPEGHEFANVSVGRNWFVAAMQRIGFIAEAISIEDAIPNLTSTWFIGVKPSLLQTEVLRMDYEVTVCPICGDSLTHVESGQNCVGCQSRARLRSMSPLIKSFLAPRLAENKVIDLPLLSFAMTGAEKKFLTTVFQSFKSVSLFGSYASDHESGVDMRDLSRYASESFCGVFGCLLFDYFQEHEKALRECFRVIVPGGVFFTHIAPYRLVDADTAPELKGAVKSRSGYFEYLPDKTELPDVKVGRDWFLAAMRRVGFEPVLVRVKDAVPGVISEWFIGIKAGGGATKSLTSIQATTEPSISTQISNVFRSVVPLGATEQGVLQFELIEAKLGNVVFLEDVFLAAPDDGGNAREIVATNGSRDQILVSRDLGETWMPQYRGVVFDSKIRWAFSLSDGGRLVRSYSGCMYHFDAGGNLIYEQSTAAWHWHGSQGIGQSSSSTVMYAEYAPLRDADGVQELSVWRYRPDRPESGWTRVLTLPAAARPPKGELRHFHVCRPHPTNPTLWILASGDSGSHCRLWLSHDDGNQWQEVTLDQADLVNMPEGKYPRLLRFTQFAALDNGDLIWGTDDTKDSNRAALIRFSISGKRPAFYFLGWLGQNCIRNISSCGRNRFLLLSESIHDPSSADCILYDATTNRITSFLLPNISLAQHPVSNSLGSFELQNGVGFFPATGAVLMHPDRRGIFKVSLIEVSS